jgi:cobalamin biosynthesis protein CobD/CbiB
MAAISGALNARLEKVGYHVLGDRYQPPETIQIRKTVYVVGFSSLVIIGIILLIGTIPIVPF